MMRCCASEGTESPDDQPIFALNNYRCGTSLSATVQSLERTSIRIPSDTHMRHTACETARISDGFSR